MPDFLTLEYLQSGNSRQRLAYKELRELGIFAALREFQPLLAGTVPLDVDLPESDLDILCCCGSHTAFTDLLRALYGGLPGFQVSSYEVQGRTRSVADFRTESFVIEVFAENQPTHLQAAYRHMLAEHRILERMGPSFREEVRALKARGVKTEPAFAKLLGLRGDPYAALLDVDLEALPLLPRGR